MMTAQAKATMNGRCAVMTRRTFFKHSADHHEDCLAHQAAYSPSSVYTV